MPGPWMEHLLPRLRSISSKPNSKRNGLCVVGSLQPLWLLEEGGASPLWPQYKRWLLATAALEGWPEEQLRAMLIYSSGSMAVDHTLHATAASLDEEKARLWPICVEHYHEFDDYQKRTDRNIPVFDCQPAD